MGLAKNGNGECRFAGGTRARAVQQLSRELFTLALALRRVLSILLSGCFMSKCILSKRNLLNKGYPKARVSYLLHVCGISHAHKLTVICAKLSSFSLRVSVGFIQLYPGMVVLAKASPLSWTFSPSLLTNIFCDACCPSRCCLLPPSHLDASKHRRSGYHVSG